MADGDLAPTEPQPVHLGDQEVDQKIKEVEEFLASVDVLKEKLAKKKVDAHQVVFKKMEDLHQLVNKWQARFVDTVNETIDEKIEGLTKQADKLKNLVDFMKKDKEAQATKKPEQIALEEAEEKRQWERRQQKLYDYEADDDEDENTPVAIRQKMHLKFANLKTPLKPEGASNDETTVDLWGEFGNLLDESRKSLKRSLLFAGGIVRGYMRRGHKKDEWVAMLRRLESRFESADAYSIAAPQANLAVQFPRLVKSSTDYSSFNEVWNVVGDLYKYRDNLSTRGALCKQISALYDKYPTYVEFYMPQLVNMWLMRKDFTELGIFVLTKCSQAPHLALSIYFYICSLGQLGQSPWQKRCFKVLQKIVRAVPFEDGTVESVPPIFEDIRESGDAFSCSPDHRGGLLLSTPTTSGSLATHIMGRDNKSDSKRKSTPRPPKGDKKKDEEDPQEELARLTKIEPPPKAKRVDKGISVPPGKEYFFKQIEFMRKLIDISRKLGEIYGKKDLYKPELDKELAKLDTYINEGSAYLPHTSDTRLRVLRFVTEESNPIPTYGRVLYRMIVESVALPSNYTKEMTDEYLCLSSDIASVGSPMGIGTPGTVEVAALYPPQAAAGPAQALMLPGGGGVTVSPSSAYGRQSRPPSIEIKFTYDFATPNIPASTVPDDNRPPRIREGSVFGEPWREVRKRLKAKSTNGLLPHWEAKSFIVKHGDFVLQEQFVMQLIVQFQKIWEQEGIPLRLVTYRIMALSYQSGLIEVVPNAVSLDKLRQAYENKGGSPNLLTFFKNEWPEPRDFEKARVNFVSSLAAYSLICYFLQIKDRHNGNIMLESEGVMFHIDFGYLLGRTIKFEKAPFKLTDEFIEVMGGPHSKLFKDYCALCVQGFIAIRKHYEKILLMVDMTINDGGAIPCLDKETITKNLRKRFFLGSDWGQAQCEEFVLNLIAEARDNWRTQIYDTYQRILNDIH